MTRGGFLIFFFTRLFTHRVYTAPKFISDDVHTGPPRADYVEMLTKLWLFAIREYGKCAQNTHITSMQV